MRHTDPGSTFDEYLKKYATETINLGGIPVLMSPVVRRNWKNGQLVDTHGDYRKSAKNVATAMNVHYVDANAITEKLESDLGEEGSKKLHMIYAAGEEAAYPMELKIILIIMNMELLQWLNLFLMPFLLKSQN